MPLVRLVVLLVGCVLPSTAAAQAWLDAYNANQYEQAANLLHEIVTDADQVLNRPDPLPLRHLTLLYANGLGVTPDPIAACALALDAEMATQMAPPKTPVLTREDADRYQAGLENAKEFATVHCGTLSPADVVTASRSRGGCYAFGMPEQVVTVGGRSVRIGRAGIGLADTPNQDMHDSNCAVAIGRVRPISIEPPDNAARGVSARHFIEVVTWRLGTDQRTRTRVYVASWQVYEVGPKGLAFAGEQMLEQAEHWPGEVLPPGFDARLTMEMIRSGHVRWRIDGAPPRRGWLMLPEEKTSQ